MTGSVITMYTVALVATLIGAVMLGRLRRRLSDPKRYGYRIAGTMFVALGLVLAIYASFLWSWSVAT